MSALRLRGYENYPLKFSCGFGQELNLRKVSCQAMIHLPKIRVQSVAEFAAAGSVKKNVALLPNSLFTNG